MLTISRKRYTYAGILNILVIPILVPILLFGSAMVDTTVSADPTPILTAIVFSIIVMALIFYLLQRASWKSHDQAIEAQAIEHGWGYSEVVSNMGIHTDMALPLLVKDSNSIAAQRNLVETPDWRYCDYAYEFYHRIKNSRWKAGDKIYAVMSANLPRKLPNVLFDSASSQGKQFATVFSGNQKIGLEGNFDTFFTTYFPEQYRVDSLSFITPEVMESLIRAKDYDIEIVHDKLYIFAPLTKASQVAAMAERIIDIKHALLNNIVTYRDERLPYDEGRAAVMPQISLLKRSKWPLVFGIMYAVLIALFYLYPYILK